MYSIVVHSFSVQLEGGMITLSILVIFKSLNLGNLVLSLSLVWRQNMCDYGKKHMARVLKRKTASTNLQKAQDGMKG